MRKNQNMKRTAFNWLLVALVAIPLVGCDLSELAEDDDEEDEPVAVATTGGTSEGGNISVPGVSEFVRIEDPVEKCFTVEVPKGWFNRAYVSRADDIFREVVTCVSPDSNTVIYMGDPKIPQYWYPEKANQVTHYLANNNPAMVKIEPHQTAREYTPGYVERKFGQLEGFTITKIEDNQEVVDYNQKKVAESGLSVEVTSVNVHFNYTDSGKKMSAIVVGVSGKFNDFWIVNASGVSTTGNAADFQPLMMKIMYSRVTSETWKAGQARIHEQKMAEIQERGRRNMATLHSMAQSHQARMDAIRAAGDASTRAYYERSAASDTQHRGFLNYINEESTVVGSSGSVRQVDNSYQRYYINRNDNSYVGGDINFDDRSIRAMGLNPDDFEEAKIRR